MSGGWNESAGAWIAALGERGDWAREHVLDAAMLHRVERRGFRSALDVGCGEGRLSRLLRQRGIEAVGVDPTHALIEEARRRDARGQYRIGKAEQLEFETGQFDLVVSCLTLIDIVDFRAAIGEMARVLKVGGSLLIANLTGFTSACAAEGWIRDEHGRALYYPVDRYLDEFAQWVTWKGVRIENWHRPLGAYMSEFLDRGLVLRFFEEPEPTGGGDPRQVLLYRRAPWFVIMEWSKPSTAIG